MHQSHTASRVNSVNPDADAAHVAISWDTTTRREGQRRVERVQVSCRLSRHDSLAVSELSVRLLSVPTRQKGDISQDGANSSLHWVKNVIAALTVRQVEEEAVVFCLLLIIFHMFSLYCLLLPKWFIFFLRRHRNEFVTSCMDLLIDTPVCSLS